jgi:hypothetical protein
MDKISVQIDKNTHKITRYVDITVKSRKSQSKSCNSSVRKSFLFAVLGNFIPSLLETLRKFSSEMIVLRDDSQKTLLSQQQQSRCVD